MKAEAVPLKTIFSFRVILSIFVSFIIGWMLYIQVSFALVFAFLLLYVLAFFSNPKKTLLFFIFFVIFQKSLVEIFGGRYSQAGYFLNYLDEGFILIAVVLSLWDQLNKKKILFPKELVFPLLGIIIVGIISTISAGAEVLASIVGLFLLLKGYLFLYIVASQDINENDLRGYLRTFGIISIAILLFGFIDFISLFISKTALINKTFIEWRFGIPSMKSLFVHPGIFGWFCAIMSLFNSVLYFMLKKKRYLLFAIILFFGVIFSMRLKSLVGFVIAMLAGIKLLPIQVQRKTKIGVICLLASLFLVFSLQLTGLFKQQIHTYIVPANPMANARNALYLTSVKIAKDFFPLGAGLGRFGGSIAADFYSPLYREYGLDKVWGLSQGGHFLTDTFWPMVLGELGIIGFCFYILLSWRIMHFLWLSTQRFNLILYKAFALSAFVIFIEAIVESIAQPVFVSPPHVYMISGIIAIVYSLERRMREAKKW